MVDNQGVKWRMTVFAPTVCAVKLFIQESFQPSAHLFTTVLINDCGMTVTKYFDKIFDKKTEKWIHTFSIEFCL